jgi:hypothetical protein
MLYNLRITKPIAENVSRVIKYFNQTPVDSIILIKKFVNEGYDVIATTVLEKITMQELLTVKEVAELKKVSVQTIYNNRDSFTWIGKLILQDGKVNKFQRDKRGCKS